MAPRWQFRAVTWRKAAKNVVGRYSLRGAQTHTGPVEHPQARAARERFNSERVQSIFTVVAFLELLGSWHSRATPVPHIVGIKDNAE